MEKYALGTAPIHFTDNEATDLHRLFGMLLHHTDDMEFSTAMAMAIIRLYCNALTPGATHDKSRYSDITLRFKHMLDTWLSKEKRPSAYASMLNISPAYLNEAVKGATGMSAGTFIRARVVLEAKRQLTYTTRSVQEIATALGYDDCSYFARMFKKETGLTPSVFRKNLV